MISSACSEVMSNPKHCKGHLLFLRLEYPVHLASSELRSTSQIQNERTRFLIELNFNDLILSRASLKWYCMLFSVMTHVAKVVELIGNSDKGWEDGAQAAVDEARKTIHGITGIEVTDMTAKIDPNTGKITEYHTTIKIAFAVEHSQ
jgi:flavin-binding protein dodecin